MIAIAAAGSVSAQTPENKEPQLQIQVDVTGKTPKEKRKDQWGEVRSKHFVVAGDADEQDLLTAASELELFRHDFAGWFPRAEGVSSVPTRVIMFRDREALRTFRPLSAEPSASAYFQAGPDLNYISLGPGEKLTRDVLREYSRTLVRDSIGPLPYWLETGIVGYFGHVTLMRLGEDRIVKFGIDGYKDVSEKKLLPIATLFKIDRDTHPLLDKDTKKAFDAQSSTLFQYLLQTRRLSAALRMINALAEGQPLDTAIRSHLKLPRQVLEMNLKNHIHMSTFDGWSIRLEGLTLDDAKRSLRIVFDRGFKTIPLSFDSIRAEVQQLPVRILSDAEADAHRGDLQLHNGRLAEAEALLLQSIRENATLAPPHASLGFAQASQKRYEEAYRSLEKARLLDPAGNALGYFYTAWAIRDQAANEAKPLTRLQLEDMQMALTDALDIAPAFVEAVQMYAQTQLLLHKDLKEPLRLLLGALKGSPGRQSLLMDLGRATMAAGDKATAGWILQRILVSGATTAEERKEVLGLLAEMKLTPEQKTAYGDFQINESAVAGVGIQMPLKGKPRKESKAEELKIVRGELTNVDCSKGLRLYIRIGILDVDQRIENLYSDTPNVEWVNDTGEEIEAVKCEKLKSPRLVAIAYRPKRKGLMMGEPVMVEFCNGASFDCDVRRPQP